MTEEEPGEFPAAADGLGLSRAEEIRARYAAIVESSDDAIIATTLDGVITAWNAAAGRMFGHAEHEAIGHPITLIIPQDLREEEHDIQRRLRTGERIAHYETARLTKTGARIDVSLSISPLRDHAGRIVGCSKIVRDITKARQAAAALRESEERFRVIANTAPVMIWMSASDAQMTYLNQTWLDYTGRPLDAALGTQWIAVLHPEELEQCREVYEKAFEQRVPFRVEHRLRRHDGEYRWAVTVGVPRYNGDGSFAGYIGTAADVTERKMAEEALSTVSQKLIEAHEEERSRIARELHDDISQRLAMVSVRLDFLRQSFPASTADLDQTLGDIHQQIRDLASDIQVLSHGLHPPKLELMGLKGAVAGFCEEVSHRHGVTIDLQFENIPNATPPEVSLCVYRVLQEALQNAVKHGGSQRTQVALTGHTNTIDLTVKDSGTGFDAEEAMKGPGLGLTSMRERLKVVGGQLSIHSERGLGTTIHAVAPLRLRTKSAKPVARPHQPH